MFLRTLLTGFVLLVLGIFVHAETFAQAPSPKLTFAFEKEGIEGSDLVFAAYLDDPTGNPIRGEKITFLIDSEFMNTVGSVLIGIVKTDENGLAALRYTPKQDGDHVIKARFAGNSVFAGAETSAHLKINPGPETYTEARPFRMPGANITMATIVLALVWGTYSMVVLQFFNIGNDKAAKELREEKQK